MQTESVLASDTGEVKRISFSEMKERYPDEWLLVGNPGEMIGLWDVTSGVVLHHSPDKKTLCQEGRDIFKHSNLDTYKVVFTGESKFPKRFMTGIFGRVK